MSREWHFTANLLYSAALRPKPANVTLYIKKSSDQTNISENYYNVELE